MEDICPKLISAIENALVQSEVLGDLVITVPPRVIAERIDKEVRQVFTGNIFSPEELMAVAALIMQATANRSFYDWEMPTLVGYTAEEMSALGAKLRELTAL